MQYRLSGIVNDSIVDGAGFRLAVFMQGCPHGCPGCHNEETWDPQGGHEADTEDIRQMLKSNPLLDGITLSGGDPFFQPEAALAMARITKDMGLNVWAYTGWTLEELQAMENPAVQALLEHIDVLVDGPFIQAQRSLALRFRGSANQRLIDLPATLSSGSVVLWA